MRLRLRQTRGARRGLVTGWLGAAALLSGCGPTAPLDLTVEQAATSVLYGQPSSSPAPAVPAPLPAPAPVFVAPVYVPLPPPATFEAATPAPTPPPACPSADPLSAAPLAAPATPSQPPPAATYAWRVSGQYQSGGSTVPFPPTSTITVGNINTQGGQGAYSFDVTDTSSGLSGREPVTTTYEVVPAPQGGTAGGVSTNQASAIYITKVVTVEPATGTTLTFVPTPPIEFMALPAAPKESWSSVSSNAGTAGAAATTEMLSGSIVGHARVDACGTLLDAWDVQVTGTITGPTQTLKLTEEYWVGTEYGGLPLAVNATYKGTDGGASVTSTSQRTTDVQPQGGT
ncbi:MAG: hypothetical protein ACYDAC_11065 [Candidatus Dormibacteria bacterium]